MMPKTDPDQTKSALASPICANPNPRLHQIMLDWGVNEREAIVLWSLWQEGRKVLRTGWPDFLSYKVDEHGVAYDILAVEVKSPTDKLTDEQALVIKLLRQSGIQCRVERVGGTLNPKPPTRPNHRVADGVVTTRFHGKVAHVRHPAYFLYQGGSWIGEIMRVRERLREMGVVM